MLLICSLYILFRKRDSLFRVLVVVAGCNQVSIHENCETLEHVVVKSVCANVVVFTDEFVILYCDLLQG